LSDLARVQGQPAYDASGEAIGSVEDVYLSDSSNEPKWVTVASEEGTPGHLFVPVEGAAVEGDGLRLPWSREQLLGSPRMSADQHLGPTEEAALHRHYAVEPGRPRGQHADADREVGSAEGEEAVVLLSGERLVTDTEEVTHRVRLRRYVTTEVETVEVPLKRERLAIERVVDDRAEPQLIEELLLRAERVVSVETETVAVEEFQVAKEVVTEEKRLTVEVAREQLDIDADVGVVAKSDDHN
jgi:stress response protein YsnF